MPNVTLLGMTQDQDMILRLIERNGYAHYSTIKRIIHTGDGAITAVDALLAANRIRRTVFHKHGKPESVFVAPDWKQP